MFYKLSYLVESDTLIVRRLFKPLLGVLARLEAAGISRRKGTLFATINLSQSIEGLDNIVVRAILFYL